MKIVLLTKELFRKADYINCCHCRKSLKDMLDDHIIEEGAGTGKRRYKFNWQYKNTRITIGAIMEEVKNKKIKVDVDLEIGIKIKGDITEDQIEELKNYIEDWKDDPNIKLEVKGLGDEK